jgi:hypothetical protein
LLGCSCVTASVAAIGHIAAVAAISHIAAVASAPAVADTVFYNFFAAAATISLLFILFSSNSSCAGMWPALLLLAGKHYLFAGKRIA